MKNRIAHTVKDIIIWIPNVRGHCYKKNDIAVATRKTFETIVKGYTLIVIGVKPTDHFFEYGKNFRAPTRLELKPGKYIFYEKYRKMRKTKTPLYNGANKVELYLHYSGSSSRLSDSITYVSGPFSKYSSFARTDMARWLEKHRNV